MASQNERYQKMLKEKLELLENQKTEVINYVSSVMGMVDKATESSKKFMKISTESKKFRKKFQEANSAVEAALNSLIKISTAFASSNDDTNSSSESESGTESSKPPTLVPQRNANPDPSTSAKSPKGYESSDPSPVKFKEKNTEESLPPTGQQNQLQKMSVNINIDSLERTVSVNQPDKAMEQSKFTSAESPLIPAVKAFLENEISPPSSTQPCPSQVSPASHPRQLRRPNNAEIAKHSPPRARTVNNIAKSQADSRHSQLQLDIQGASHFQGGQGDHSTQHLPHTMAGISSADVPQQPPAPSPSYSSHSSSGGFNQSHDIRIPLLSPRSGDQMEVVISHVISPSKFWIQDTKSCVKDLVQQMSNFYCQAKIPIPIPHPGLVCCARFSNDGGWYRAQILDVQYPNPNTVPQDIQVRVFFVDYGNSETTSTSNIRCLHKKFYEVPPLALCCGLAQITPPYKTGQWTNEGNTFFNALCLGKCVQAEVIHPKVQAVGVPLVRLYYLEKMELEEGVMREEVVDVAEVLVRKGLANAIVKPAPPSPIDTSAKMTKLGELRQMNTSTPLSSIAGEILSSKSPAPGQSVQSENTDSSGPCEGKHEKDVGGELISENLSKVKAQTQEGKGEPSEETTDGSNNLEKEKTKHLKITMRADLPIIEGRILMAMSFIVNPNEFYIHLITPDALEFDTHNEKLQAYYNDSKNLVAMDSVRHLAAGDFCCAKFEKDLGWYRGKILEVRTLGPKGGRKRDFMVFYVDYGNSEWVLETNVKPLVAEFYDMPAQVVKCSLAHVSPFVPKGNKDSNVKWTEQAIKTFSKLTGFETKLFGFVVTIPKDESKAVEVNLTISTTHMEVYVNQELVNLGFASSALLKKDSEEDDELEVASSKWLEHRYSEGGYGDSDTGLPDSPDSLMDALEKLDPMAVHYHSEINTYGFDRDDAEMATMGYKSNLDKRVCYYHVSGKGCYRGENCQYEHPDPVPCRQNVNAEPVPRKRTPKKLPKCTKAHAVHQWLGLPCPKKDNCAHELKYEVKDTTLCYCLNNVVDLLPEESIICIMVTAIISPIHFWVQFVFGPRPLNQLKIHCSRTLERPWEEGETLESLNEAINDNCKKRNTRSHDMTILALGEIVLSRYSKDKKWYRSRIIFVDGDKIEVFHVDYGTSAWVQKHDIKPALPQFLHLPFQAVQCRLDGLKESQECKGQKENARNYFEDIATGHPLVAYVIERDIDNLLYLKLYNTFKSEDDIYINKALVDKGYYRQRADAEK